MTAPVLVMDYENQSFGCNGFLLQLAGFSVTEMSRVSDALNLVIHRQQSEQPFTLLVTSNLPEDEIVQVIRLLHLSSVSLPILITNRTVPADRETLYEPSALGRNVFFCRPEKLGPAARSIIDSDSGSATTTSA
jgi:hypothetical protein